jgi:permuted papain-like amidase YaeF/Yiix C92 family enzyme
MHGFTSFTSRGSLAALAARLKIGDLIFIRVPARPFREVATATGSWTNHVGVVVDAAHGEPTIAESTFPFSRTKRLSRFVARSEKARVAVARLASEPTGEQQRAVVEAASKRARILYDTGFNLRSRRQFCSRYVREVMWEATGASLGEVETFATLLARRPDTNLRFWKLWYFGRIPWQRETVTPASVLHSPALRLVFDGVVSSAPVVGSRAC